MEKIERRTMIKSLGALSLGLAAPSVSKADVLAQQQVLLLQFRQEEPVQKHFLWKGEANLAELPQPEVYHFRGYFMPGENRLFPVLAGN
jgi:hypothetical protein